MITTLDGNRFGTGASENRVWFGNGSETGHSHFWYSGTSHGGWGAGGPAGVGATYYHDWSWNLDDSLSLSNDF